MVKWLLIFWCDVFAAAAPAAAVHVGALGTPIGDRGLDDLWGLLKFLQAEPWASSGSSSSSSSVWWREVIHLPVQQRGCPYGEVS
jgi:hypothetical protein